MTTEFTRFTIDDGGDATVIVKTPGPESRVQQVSRAGKAVASAGVAVRDALGPVTEAASRALEGFQSMTRKPDEVELTLGVDFDAEFGMVIASSSAGAHLEVTLRWNRAGTVKPG